MALERAALPVPTTTPRKRRPRPQCADQVFVSSASVHYLVSGTTEQKNPLNEVNVNPLYMNTSQTAATKDEHVDLTYRDVAGLATFRVIMPEDHHRECQEITFFVGDRDSENHYETLTNQAEVVYSQQEYDDYDSFDSDSDSEDSNKLQQHDSGVDMGNYKLPDPPQSGQTYALTRFATAAGKSMQKLRRNWSLTKNDISKSLSKIAKRKSTTDLKPTNNSAMKPLRPSPPIPVDTTNNKQNLKEGINYQNIPFNSSSSTDKRSSEKDIYSKSKLLNKKHEDSYQNTNFHSSKLTSNPSQQYINLEISKSQTDIKNIKDKSPNSEDSNNLSRKKYWSFKSKFKRSLSAAPGQFSTGTNNGQLSPSKSTFYLANSADVDSECSTSDPLSSPDKPVPTSRRKSRPMSTPDESKAYNRKSTPTLRPLSPPPPPPVNTDPKKPSRSKYSNAPSTSWYAECGLFKPDHTHGKGDINRLDRERSSSTSWYTEIGLYQTSNLSTTSSSTERSTGQDSGADCDTLQSSKSDQMHIFQDEPLYQFYNQAKLESACRHLTFDSDTDTDGYEEIGSPPPITDTIPPIHRPTAMELINPHGASRTLWCEIPEVINSAVLSTLSAHQKRLQEAKFELITSEASYLNSLDLLHRHFESHPQFDDPSVLNKSEKSQLFSNIKSVKKCSMNFLADMEHCWQDNILLGGICDIVCDHAEKHFQVYITYCEKQFYMDKTLKKLKENRGPFAEILKQLESNSTCQGLSLHSFLMLPMQRITRLPLLIDAVLKRLNQGDDEYKICQIALATLTQIVSKCNDAARITEQMEELSMIARQIEFPNTITPVSILPAGQLAPARYLVKSGTLTQIIWREDAKLTFGKKFVKLPLYFFLFTDLMVITKKKSEDAYVVVDYCSRSLIQVSPGSADGSPLNIKDSPGKPVLLVTLIENHDGKTVEMMMSCSSETDQQRWLQACSPPSSENPEETLYEEWDCPQVTAIHSYVPRQADELALEAGDVVNVNRKMADGWYHGERIRDSAQGWFPGNYTLEVASAHVRARNLKQRYRLLALSGSYLESQKRK